MSTLTKEIQMLYCPNCKRKYEDGSQRFCNNDGGRLQPQPESGTRRSKTDQGVFTSLLGRGPAPFENDEILPQSNAKADLKNRAAPKPERPEKEPLFRSERMLAPDLASDSADEESVPEGDPLMDLEVSPDVEPSPPVFQPLSEIPTRDSTKGRGKLGDSKPISRLIDPREIASGRAELGDRNINPSGRDRFSQNKPDALTGKVVKGRYRILEMIDQDSASTIYLAEDNILTGKQVVVRVLSKDLATKSFEQKIFQEERVSLSHVDHPNIAKVIDSGELPEGEPFIVTAERRDNSAANLIESNTELDPSRVARIIRQASYALSEVHQNGILHRNLKPDHILLSVTEHGNETVKVTDFCISDGKVTSDNFLYKAPEQIGGQLPTFASDSFSLAVIAYQLLTGRLPFDGENERKLIALQKEGLQILPSQINRKVPPKADEVFQKALAFEPAERYPKSRDFGEAFFEAVASDLDSVFEFFEPEGDEEIVTTSSAAGEQPEIIAESEVAPIGFEDKDEKRDITSVQNLVDSIQQDEKDQGEEQVPGEKAASTESLWKNRSPEVVEEKDFRWTLLPALGILVLVLAAFGIWQYFLNQAQDSADLADTAQTNQRLSDAQGVDSVVDSAKITDSDIETPPPPRQVAAPANTIYFENSKLSLSEGMVRRFLPFSLYYPESWKRNRFDKEQNRVDDKFLDVAISDGTGIPIEQLSISPYESNGTFKTDTELFAKLVEKSNKDTSEALRPGSFKVISQGATTIQNGRWKAYQVNFESKGNVDGKPLTIWGRRLWLPVQRPGARNGFIITMLATSLSKDVKGADDVGKKGGLKLIVQTFEPSQEF